MRAPGFLLVFIGGGMGSALRYAVGAGLNSVLGPQFPFGTLLINVSGSLAMGLAAGWVTSLAPADRPVRLLLMTGILGGFTTYSTYALDTAQLWQRHDGDLALAYVAATLLLGLGAVFVGLTLARLLVTSA